jgi:hypothetical protein
MKPSDYIRRGWTQGTLAENADGVHVIATDSDACKWCLMGAINASFGTVEKSQPALVAAQKAIAELTGKNIGNISLSQWNDEPGRTQEEVIKLLEGIGQ